MLTSNVQKIYMLITNIYEYIEQKLHNTLEHILSHFGKPMCNNMLTYVKDVSTYLSLGTLKLLLI